MPGFPARGPARPAVVISSRRATSLLAKHPVVRRAVHVAIWFGEATAFATVISAVMMALIVLS